MRGAFRAGSTRGFVMPSAVVSVSVTDPIVVAGTRFCQCLPRLHRHFTRSTVCFWWPRDWTLCRSWA